MNVGIVMLKIINSIKSKIFKSQTNNDTSSNKENTSLNTENTENTPEKETFCHLFQKELFIVVLKQIDFFPSKITHKSLCFSGNICLNIALTNKNFYNHLKYTLFDLSRMHFLYTKYSKFNSEYETPEKHFFGNSYENIYNFSVPPILIDALNSGCRLPYAKHSSEEVNFNDVKEIIRLIPNTIHSNLGELRCRSHITPFVCAAFNNNINEEVLLYLLDHGCNPNTFHKVNGQLVSFIEDIKDCDENRYNLLLKILKSRCSN